MWQRTVGRSMQRRSPSWRPSLNEKHKKPTGRGRGGRRVWFRAGALQSRRDEAPLRLISWLSFELELRVRALIDGLMTHVSGFNLGLVWTKCESRYSSPKPPEPNHIYVIYIHIILIQSWYYSLYYYFVPHTFLVLMFRFCPYAVLFGSHHSSINHSYSYETDIFAPVTELFYQ